jgi:hypothetical protein
LSKGVFDRRTKAGRYGAYSREIRLAQVDRRSRKGRLLDQMRAVLTEQLGGRLSPTQTVLIERAAMLQLRCAVLDARIIDGTFSEYDAKTYLAFSNSLTRTMVALGFGADAGPPQDPMAALHRHIAARQGEAA